MRQVPRNLAILRPVPQNAGAAAKLRKHAKRTQVPERFLVTLQCMFDNPRRNQVAWLLTAICSYPYCRDECVTAHLPDQQWELILQSLQASGNNDSQLNNIPAAVVVEAGVLVRVENHFRTDCMHNVTSISAMPIMYSLAAAGGT